MTPASFPEANRNLLPPAGMTREECGDLPVHTDGQHCISAWRPSWRERLSILLFGRIWLWVWSGHTQPPVALATENPFAKPVSARERLFAAIGLLLLLAFFVLPVHAQDPQTIPPVAPAEVLPSPEPPKAKLYRASFEAGPSTVSTPEDLAAHATVRATLVGEPFKGWRFFAHGRADRTADGSAFTIEAFKSFRSAEALAGALYRIRNSPVSVIGVGAMSWSLEQGTPLTIRDPNLWSFGGGLCLEKWNWWPEGGLACAGVGRWAGRDGVRFDFTYPIKGGAYLIAGTDVPFHKLPEFLRALPGALVPLTGPPTVEQIQGVQQRLPVTVRVGVVVRPWGREF